jgi:hypothetical protein
MESYITHKRNFMFFSDNLTTVLYLYCYQDESIRVAYVTSLEAEGNKLIYYVN